MRKHKQICAFFLFMLVFVQSSLYFFGAKLPERGLRNEERVRSFQEKEKKAAAIIPLSSKEIKQFWTREKKSPFSFTDFSHRISYIDPERAEKKFYSCKEKQNFGRWEKSDLSDSLRAPPEAEHMAIKAA